MNRYWFRFEYDDIDDGEGSEIETVEDTEIVDADSMEQAEEWLYEYNLSHYSSEQVETVKILQTKFMGEVPDKRQLRFAI